MALKYDIIYMDEDGTPIYGLVDDGMPDDTYVDDSSDRLSDDTDSTYVDDSSDRLSDDTDPIYVDDSSDRLSDDKDSTYIDDSADRLTNPTIKTKEDAESWLSTVLKSFGKSAYDTAKKAVFNGGDPANGLNFAGIATAVAGAGVLYQKYKESTGQGGTPPTGGYSVPVPTTVAINQRVPYPEDPNRRPGESGRSYFTNMQYAAPADAAAAQTAANAQAQGIASAYVPKAAAVNPYESGDKAFKVRYNQPADPVSAESLPAASGVASLLPISDRMPKPTQVAGDDAFFQSPEYKAFQEDTKDGIFTMATHNSPYFGQLGDSRGIAQDAAYRKYKGIAEPSISAAHGGLMSFAKGGANYLRGRTDGMADKLNTSIDNKQAAKLSHGEFVIPADVVSHLGNGNSDAGADKLYQMMARIRKARTGNPKQGKRINPDKFMPGGLASLNMGGAIGFAVGGTTTGAGAITSPGTSTSSSLSSWAGPYVTNTLSEGAALAAKPYEAYTGPLTAGASDLQNQAFAGAKTVAGAGYDPTKFNSGTFGAAQAQQYMNPYLSAVLDPQMKELQRQADITRVENAGRMTQRGAYGGSRQAISESEDTRNLRNTQADTLGRGYASAYDKAMGQFNTQADRDMGAQKASEESRQFSANFGLKSLADLERMGATQRQIEAEGVAADKTQFEENRDNPAAMVKFKRDLITGLPMSTSTNTKLPMDSLGEIVSSVGGLSQFYALLKNFGINATPPATTAATTPPK